MSSRPPPSSEEQPLNVFDPLSSASFSPQGVSNSHPHLYFQQTTSSILYSTIVFTFLGTIIGLALFSWVRTRRSSIYGSRQFFVREEHRAEALSDSLLGWIPGLFFLERTIERRLESEASAITAMRPQGQVVVGGGGGGGSSNAHVTQLHSLTEKDSRIGGGVGGGGGQGSDNNSNSTPTNAFGSSMLAGIWGRLTELLVAGKASAVNIIQSNNTSASIAFDLRETKEEVDPTNDEPSATASTTLKLPHQARSTMSFNSATSSQHQQQQSATSRHTANGSSSSKSLSLSNKASTLARQEIIAKIGLDHYLLIRFLKMLFAVSMILGITAISTLVPLYVIRQTGEDLQGNDDILGTGSQPMRRVEILQIGNVIDNERLWAAVLAVTLFSGNF